MNAPVTIKQAYLNGLKLYSITSTNTCIQDYESNLKKDKFPMTSRVAVRQALENVDPDNVSGWMKVFANLFGEPSIAATPRIPAIIGACVVMLAAPRSSSTVQTNTCCIITNVHSDSFHVANAANDKTALITGSDLVRYATPDEIEKFFNFMPDVVIAQIRGGALLRELNKFAEGLPVFFQEDEQEDKPAEETTNTTTT